MTNDEIKRAYELSKWYAKLAENGNGWKVNDNDGVHGPNMHSDLSKFITNPPKPKLKEINLSVCIESGIDMEFSNVMFDSGQHVDRLVVISQENMNKYACQEDYWDQCRVRQNHWHFWGGGKCCPLPDGLLVALQYRDDRGVVPLTEYRNMDYQDDWLHCDDGDIIGFKVLGVADGWKYPWEEDE